MSEELSKSFALSDQNVQSVVFSSERLTRRRASVARNKGPEEKSWMESVAGEIREDLDRIHQRSREACGYKRKDLSADLSESLTGRLTTPDFAYSVQVGISDDDPTEVRWSREVSLRGADKALGAPQWLSVFGEELDTVAVRFAQTVDVADVIDRVEEREPAGVRVDYDVTCSWCELSLEGVPATLRLEGREMRVLSKPGTSLTLAQMLSLVNLPRFGL